jgi:serine/threonine-protein kinase
LPSFITNQKEEPKGTALYSAPEKWDGDFTQGFKGDVFAFGVTAYYACTGKYPFEGTLAQIDQAVHEGKPAAPLKAGHTLLRTTADLIMSCLEKNPQRRPTMERVARAFAESAELVKGYREAK